MGDLHARGILHRDISTANIMISVDGRGRLIDLGMAGARDNLGGIRRSIRMASHNVQWVLSFRSADLFISQGTTGQFASTQLFFNSRKVHELCDDLESLWFVLLFECLHFVKHNKPEDMDMPTIYTFDGSERSRNDYPGLGKWDLYRSGLLMPRVLKFDSKPFTTLIRQIYRLFRSFHRYCEAQDMKEASEVSVGEDAGKLKSCAEIERLLGEALNSKGWPTDCDKVEDQYPPVVEMTVEQMDIIAMSYVNRPIARPGVLPAGKRKREEEGDPPVSSEVTKRPKISPPW